MLKVLFFGTPRIAAVVLEKLIESHEYEIVGVVSQPDKEVGRKKILTPTPVKEVALAHNIPVFQPIKLRLDYEFVKELKPDLIITTAYGQILPQGLLDIPTIKCVNVHGSLLPSYRGGAPIQRSIINGDTITGVTIMEMVAAMDAGNSFSKEIIPISENMTSSELFDVMGEVGAKLLLKTLPDIINGYQGIPQDESLVTFAYNITKEEEKINFTKRSQEVHNLIRGLCYNPGAYALYGEKKIKIYKTLLTNVSDDTLPGTLKIENKKLYVKCQDYYLEIIELQMEGKSMMDAKAFLNGVNKETFVKEKLI